MDNIFLMNTNTCCNALVKIGCWLILAKYRSSKLEVLKKVTEDAALNEFETRLFLRNYYVNCAQNDKFLNFTQKVYNRAMFLITDYICSPDWSLFYDEGNNSIWQLKTMIQNEMVMASTTFNSESHPNCYHMFYRMKDQIVSIIDIWSNAVFIYSNYISASLSEIFTDKMKKIICKYEKYPNNCDFKWLCDEIMTKCGHDQWTHLQCDEDENHFWFINEALNLPFFDENFSTYNYFMPSEEELILLLSNWLFRESISQLKINTKRLINFQDANTPEGESEMKIFRKEQLSEFLKVPIVNLELHLTMSSTNEFLFNFNVSEGPHYYVPESTITELHPPLKMYAGDSTGDVTNNFAHCAVDNLAYTNMNTFNSEFFGGDFKHEEKSGFDLIDSILSGKRDNANSEYDFKLSNIKVELEDFCAADDIEIEKEYVQEKTVKRQENSTSKVSLPKLQIKGRHEVQKPDKIHDMYPAVQHKKRGRPRKIDDYSQNTLKNGQHKYSPEDVQDCSIWISDNFYEVAGNKPAIDRARMYELYTNYCLLKLCTPVDRALFGKIIRKVFPKLKSRRLIQNQVLKYHYVGLKPKYSELEQALLYSDSSSMNPGEILLTYVPLEE